MCAAGGGHEAVAELLLQHGADVAAARHDGSIDGGHEAVLKADARAAMHDGSQH